VNELPLADVVVAGSSSCESSSETTGCVFAVDVAGELTERPAASGRVGRGGEDVMGEDEPEMGGLAETWRGCLVDHLQLY
jgi:hypothetical protein